MPLASQGKVCRGCCKRKPTTNCNTLSQCSGAGRTDCDNCSEIICTAGKVLDGCGLDSEGLCVNCQFHTYAEEPGHHTECTQCGETDACAVGQVLSNCALKTRGDCTTCSAHEFSFSGGSLRKLGFECTRCDALTCPPGFYRDGCGTTFSEFDPNIVVASSFGICTPCPSGRFRPEGAAYNECAPCPFQACQGAPGKVYLDGCFASNPGVCRSISCTRVDVRELCTVRVQAIISSAVKIASDQGIVDVRPGDSDAFGSAVAWISFGKEGTSTQIPEALAVGASRDPTAGGGEWEGGLVSGNVAWWRVGSLYLFRVARIEMEPPATQLHLADAKDVTVLLRLRISHCGLPPANGDEFAYAVSSLGDLDGDGVHELAIAAPYRESPIYSYTDAGVVCIIFLSQAEKETSAGQISVKFSNVISLDTLEDAETEETRALQKHFSRFGCSLASLGDVNADGVPDMAASACGADDDAGAVVVLHLSAAGQVLAAKTISKTAQGLGYIPLIMRDILPLHHSSLPQLRFGEALAAVGDVDGDGHTELAVSVGRERVLVLLSFSSSGTLKGSKLVKDTSGAVVKIATRALSAAADLNSDSVPDIIYGGNGTVGLLLLNRDATVQTKQSIVFTGDYLFDGLDLGEKETYARLCTCGMCTCVCVCVCMCARVCVCPHDTIIRL